MTRAGHFQPNAQDIADKLDALSRTRALDERESKLLEWALGVVDGKIPLRQRIPYGTNIVMARLGFKRDMTTFRSKNFPAVDAKGAAGRETIRKRNAERRRKALDE